MRIRLAMGCLLLVLRLSGQEPGFVSLFDGKSLDGWVLNDRKGPGYVAEGGMLVCPEGGGGNLFTKDEFANFVLRLEFRMFPGANNGVGIRAPLEGRTSREGMEIQIRDDSSPVYKKAQLPVKNTGSIYDVVPAKTGFLKAPREWNAMEITADRRRVRVRLNEHEVVNADLDAVKDQALLNLHPGLERASGHIGLLGHSTRVEFRNIRVRRLP